jgi:hypothetical protein
VVVDKVLTGFRKSEARGCVRNRVAAESKAESLSDGSRAGTRSEDQWETIGRESGYESEVNDEDVIGSRHSKQAVKQFPLVNTIIHEGRVKKIGRESWDWERLAGR